MKLTFKDILKLCAGVFLLYLGVHYWQTAASLVKLVIGASMPLLIGCVIAYVVNILMRSYEQRLFTGNSAVCRMLRRPVCMLLAFVTLVAVVVLIVWLILPQLVSCVQVIVAELPGFFNDMVDLIDEFDLMSEDVIAYLEGIDWKEIFTQMIGVIKSGLGSVMDVVVDTVSSVFSGIVTALVAVIFSIYLLADKETLGSQFHRVAKRYLKESWYETLCYLLGVVDDCFHRYIVGQCIEAVILGILCAIGMAILGLPYATMVGTLVAFTALIPVAGAYIGAAVGAFMILTVDPFQALVFLIFLVVLQQIEGNLIYPRVVGSSMGLPGIWVLAAVSVGGGIMGITGMLLGVPLAAAVYRIIRDDVRCREGVSAVPVPAEAAPALAREELPAEAVEKVPAGEPKQAKPKQKKKKKK